MDDDRSTELTDEQIVTAMPGSTGTARASQQLDRDADGTDGDAKDADGTDGDATDGTDGDAKDADGTDGDATDGRDADGTDTPATS